MYFDHASPLPAPPRCSLYTQLRAFSLFQKEPTKTLSSLVCCRCIILSRVAALSWEGLREFSEGCGRARERKGGIWQPEGNALSQLKGLECISPMSWTAGWSPAFPGSRRGCCWEPLIAWWAAVLYWEIRTSGCSCSLRNICKRSLVGGDIIDSHMACRNPDSLLGPAFRSRLRKSSKQKLERRIGWRWSPLSWGTEGGRETILCPWENI